MIESQNSFTMENLDMHKLACGSTSTNITPKMNSFKPTNKLVRNMSIDQDFPAATLLITSDSSKTETKLQTNKNNSVTVNCSGKNTDGGKLFNQDSNSKNLETISEISVSNGPNNVVDRTNNTQIAVVEKLKSLHTDISSSKETIDSSNCKNTPNLDTALKTVSEHYTPVDVKKSKSKKLCT